MNKGAYKDEGREFLTKLINMLPERSLGKTEIEMKSSKDAEKRYDDMKQFFSTRRQDRGDRVERVEKVADYLKNLNIDSEDESISEDEGELKGSQAMKKRNDFEGFGGGKMNSFLKKNKMDESLSSSETSSTLSLSDLSLDSEEEDDIDDEIVKDPFGKKKNEKNQKANKLRKPKYEDLDKTAKKGEISGLMDTLMNFEKKTNQDKKNPKINPDKIKQASGKTNMKDLQKHIDKKLTKLSDQNGPTMDMSKTRKNKKPTNSSGSSDLSPEEEFFRYLQGTKGKKILESIGKKVDVSPNAKTTIEESLAEFSRTGGRTSAKMLAKNAQSTKVTEPSRPAPMKKIPAKEPTIAKLPDIGTKTGTIAKIPNKDINIKTKMTIAAKDPTKLGGSSKDAKIMPTKLETKPERLEAGAKKAFKKAPTKK